MTGRWRLLRFSTFILLLSVAGARTATAAELDWQAAPGCPERDIVEHRLRIAIGMPLAQAGNNRFKCTITRSPKGSYRLELRVEGPSTRSGDPPRIIEAATCVQVTDTAVIAIALALGEHAVEPTPSGSEEKPQNAVPLRDETSLSVPGKTKEEATSTLSEKTAASAAAPAYSSPIWAAARLGPVVDTGSLPRLAFGLEPALALGYSALSARLSGTLFADQRKTLPDASGGEFSLWSVALSLCGSTPRERAHAALCAGAEVGRMTGNGFGSVTVARQGSATWVAPRLQFELVTAPSLFGMRGVFGVMAGMPLMRRPFIFGTSEQVHRPASIAGRLSLGLEIDWQ